MAVIKNTVWGAVDGGDVDSGQVVTSTTIKTIVGDCGYLEDIATGNHATDWIRHDGDGRGALIGQPYCADLVPIQCTSQRDGAQSKILWAIPIMVPRGESAVDVLVACGVPARVVSLDASLAEVDSRDVSTDGEQLVTVGVTAGEVNVVQLIVPPGLSNDFAFTFPVICHARAALGIPALASAPPSNGTFSLNTTTASGKTVIDLTTFDEVATDSDAAAPANGMVEADAPFSTYVATQINRNLNAIGEFLTGAPAGASATLSTDGTPASQTALYANTGEQHSSVYTSGRAIYLPLAAQAFGAVLGDLSTAIAPSSANTRGALSNVSGSAVASPGNTFAQARIMVPSTAATLRCAVLVANLGNGSAFTIGAYATNGTHTGSASASVADKSLGLLDFALSGYTAGTNQTFDLNAYWGANKTGGVGILGYCFYLSE